MVEFINNLTGGRMWVADDRVEEYKAAGHKLAAVPEANKSTKKQPADKKGTTKK